MSVKSNTALKEPSINDSSQFTNPVTSELSQPLVRKRDGSSTVFDPQRIFVAVEKAFKADLNLQDDEELSSENLSKVNTDC